MGNSEKQLVRNYIKKLKRNIRKEIQVNFLLHVIQTKLFNKYKRPHHPIPNCVSVNYLTDP